MGMFMHEVQTKYAGNTEQSSLGNSKYILWVIFSEGSDHRVSIIKALSISKLLKELKTPFSHTSLEV